MLIRTPHYNWSFPCPALPLASLYALPHTMSYQQLRVADEPPSSVQFLRDGLLLTSFYPSIVQLYTVHENDSPALLADVGSPSAILSVANTHNACVLGHFDGVIRCLDPENMKVTPLLHPHADAIGFCKSPDGRTVLAASFAGEIWHVDPRAPHAAHRIRSTGKISAFDASEQHLVVARGLHIEIFDVRRLEAPLFVRASGLRYMVNALRILPDDDGYALGSLDGRVSIDFFDELEAAALRRFAFKCHRAKNVSGMDSVCPVTGLAFHPHDGALLTSGGDGRVCVWNLKKRKRVRQFPAAPGLPVISHMDLSSDGMWLAVGAIQGAVLRSSDRYTCLHTSGAAFVRNIAADMAPRL